VCVCVCVCVCFGTRSIQLEIQIRPLRYRYIIALLLTWATSSTCGLKIIIIYEPKQKTKHNLQLQIQHADSWVKERWEFPLKGETLTRCATSIVGQRWCCSRFKRSAAGREAFPIGCGGEWRARKALYSLLIEIYEYEHDSQLHAIYIKCYEYIHFLLFFSLLLLWVC